MRCFVLVRKLEEKGLQAREANGWNDERTNASESGFVFRSCSYANVVFFLGTKSDADDANRQTDMRTRPLEQAVELLRNGVVAIQKNRPQQGGAGPCQLSLDCLQRRAPGLSRPYQQDYAIDKVHAWEVEDLLF